MEPPFARQRPPGMTRSVVTRVAILALAIAVVGCTANVSPAPSVPRTASATASPVSMSPGPTGPLTLAQLKVRLIDAYGPLWYCDPDVYPVARQDEGALALQAWPTVVADAEALAAIRAQWGITSPDPTAAEKLAIYHEWKMLRAIVLDPVGPDRWRYDYLPQPVTPGAAVTRTLGTIDAVGRVLVDRTEPGRAPSCPICLARGQPIWTPGGPVAVERLRRGDPVWSLDGRGRRIAAIVIALGSSRAPAGHAVVRLLLADGRTLLASPGHPLLDGRRIGALANGDRVDGSRVISVDRVPYGHGETHDLLASGPTGSYAVDGIWLHSTLSP